MRKKWLLLFLLLLLWPLEAFAERKADFSDMAAPGIVIPFQTVDYSVHKEGYVTYQTTRVAESFKKVSAYFSARLGSNSEKIGEYYLTGFTLNAQTGEYNGVLALSNEHYYFVVRPDGTGTAIVFESTPRSFVSGKYVISMHGYRLPDGSVFPADTKGEDGL